MFEPDQPWHPRELTAPLSTPFVSDGPRLVQLIERYWRTPDKELIQLDQWQKSLLSHVLERYPLDWPVEALRGRLRYRQVVISMGRQNGKSVLGGILALYGLLQHVRGPSVIGIATSVEQANVIYNRVAFTVKNSEPLLHKLRATGTRGIRHRDGSGEYLVKPALEEGLQSVPITLCTADELHLAKPAMWDSVVNGQRAQRDALIVGITTAGDDTSVLLKRLYDQGRKAIAGGAGERFGFFLWEAPEGATIDTPGAIEAANPSIACGRIDIETVRSDVRELPEPDQQRYTLNRFVASVNSLIPTHIWASRGTGGIPADAPTDQIVWGVDRTPSWEFATITASIKIDGRLHTEVVASIAKPNLDQLATVCDALASSWGGVFAMDSYALSALGKELRSRGREVWLLTLAEVAQASASFYAAVVQNTISHAGDPLLTAQIPRARRRNVGEGWRISRADSSVEIDAVLSTVLGCHVAATKPAVVMQLF